MRGWVGGWVGGCVCVCACVYIYIYIWCSAARPPPAPPPHGLRPCGVGSPLPLPPCGWVGCAPFHGYGWLGVRLLRVWTLGCDTVPLNSDLPLSPKPMIVMNIILAMMMTKMVVMIPIRTLLRSLAQESRMKIIQPRAQAYL